MTQLTHPSDRRETASFAEQAEQRSPSLARDIVDLLRQNKKWWLIPVVAVLLVVGLIVVLGGTAVAPFIYTLF